MKNMNVMSRPNKRLAQSLLTILLGVMASISTGLVLNTSHATMTGPVVINSTVCLPQEDSNLAASLSSLSINPVITSSFQSCNAVVVSTGYLSHKPLDIMNSLAARMSSGGGFVVVLSGANDQRQNFLGAWMKALTINHAKMPVMPIISFSSDKKSFTIDTRMFTAPLIAFSFKPFGVSISESALDLASNVAWAVNNFESEAGVPSTASISSILEGGGAQSQGSSNQISSLTESGMSFIGYIGWRTSDIHGWFGEYEGTQSVKVEYYYTSATTGNGKYEFFLAHIWHSAYGVCAWTGCYSPNTWDSVTDWKTSTYAGQVLHDWGPKNSGTNAQVTFGLTVGADATGPQASASITYGVPGGLQIDWADQTVPQNGYVKAHENMHTHGPDNHDTTYTVEPTSTGFLDPTLPAGGEPMIVSHSFSVTVDIDCCGGSGTSLSFNAWLYSNSVQAA